MASNKKAAPIGESAAASTNYAKSDSTQTIRGYQHSMPRLRVQFHFPVTLKNIRGEWFPSFLNGAFIVVWGRFNNCYAYLHDFDPVSMQILIEECRAAINYQRFPHEIFSN